MSSTADNSKRRRACDVCRRSKIRCNVSTSDDTPCAHCSRFKLDCTFVDDTKRRAPSKGYVNCLENRCKKLELLVKRIAPDMDIEAEVGPSFTQDTWSDIASISQQFQPPKLSPTHQHIVESAKPSTHVPSTYFSSPVDSEEDLKDRLLNESFGNLRLNADVPSRFHGKSSGFDWVRMAMAFKDNAVGNQPGTTLKATSPRAKFWTTPIWKSMGVGIPSMAAIAWPPDDLLESLVNLHFIHNAPMLPIIYRPSFEQNIKSGLHKTDINFAKLLLAVCALASKFCDDPQVCTLNTSGEPDWTCAGWKYFGQVISLHQTVFGPSSLSTLQTCALICTFSHYVGAGHVAWLLSGIGIRFALDIGLHREKVYLGDQPLVDELWKRTFWALITIDIVLSSRLGRPTAVALHEIDAKLPVEVSDEYYDEVTKQWNQPSGEPRQLSGFVNSIKLEKLASRAIQTVYVAEHPSPSAVVDIDNALSKWLDELPSHLRWDLVATDSPYQAESALLRLKFLRTRTTVYRRFLPGIIRDNEAELSVLSASAVAICTTAAQNIVRILDALGGKTLGMTGIAFGAAVILLLNVWDAQRKGLLNVDVSGHMQDVQRCIQILRAAETRSKSSGIIVDILTGLASMNEGNSLELPPTTRQKRTRDDDVDDVRPPRVFQPDVGGVSMPPTSFMTSQPLENQPDMPSAPHAPGAFDIGTMQWNPAQADGFMPAIENYTFAGFNIPGFDGNPSGFDLPYSGLDMFGDSSQHLFGNTDSANDVSQPTGHDILEASNIDWATELTFLGMNPGTGADGPFQS